MGRRYFKRRCDEPRRDEYDAWGTSEWYFELDEDNRPLRQLEQYENGIVVKYDTIHTDDQYGGISETSSDISNLWQFEISSDEFEAVWSLKALNQD